MESIIENKSEVLLNKTFISNKVIDGKKIYHGIVTKEIADLRNNVFSVQGTDWNNVVLKTAHAEDVLPDGRLPYPAVLNKMWKSKDANGIPQIEMSFQFLDTPLGQDYQTIADAGVTIDLSSGVMVDMKQAQQRFIDNSPKGYFFPNSMIQEVSFCMDGINPAAKITNAKQVNECIKNNDIHGAAQLIRNSDGLETIKNMIVDINKDITNRLENLEGKLKELSNSTHDAATGLQERLDEIAAFNTVQKSPIAHKASESISERDAAQVIEKFVNEMKTGKK